jgi:hypothetical protein
MPARGYRRTDWTTPKDGTKVATVRDILKTNAGRMHYALRWSYDQKRHRWH